MTHSLRRPALAGTAFLLVLLLLAACFRASPPEADEEPQPPAEVLTGLHMQISSGPVNLNGLLEPLTVHVSVIDHASGKAVTFDEDLVADPDGLLDHFTFESDAASVSVTLVDAKTYVFSANAYDDSGNLLASGSTRHTVDADRANAINLAMTTLLGSAALEPRLPVTTLMSGQEVELVLSVSANGRPDLTVPVSSFSASFEIRNGETLAHGSRGITFRAVEREPGSSTVTATVAGLVAEDGSAVSGELTATFSRGFGSAIGVDIENPEVSNLSFDPDLRTLFGVATDNFGVASLDIYDGPVHLASTDLDLVESRGLATVTFPGGGTAFIVVLDLAPGTYEITAVAKDAGGSHNEVSREVTITTTRSNSLQNPQQHGGKA